MICTQYHPHEIDRWKQELASAVKAHAEDVAAHYEHKMHEPARGRIPRLHLVVEILSLGYPCEDAQDGILIAGKVVVAVQRKRWRIDGRWQWYWYKELRDIIDVIEGRKPGETRRALSDACRSGTDQRA